MGLIQTIPNTYIILEESAFRSAPWLILLVSRDVVAEVLYPRNFNHVSHSLTYQKSRTSFTRQKMAGDLKAI